MILLALVAGAATGAGVVLWRQDRPTTPSPFHPDEHAVELVLFQAVPLRTPPGGRRSEIGPLHVDGAVLLSGAVTSTVLVVDVMDRGLEVSAPGLPVTVSRSRRLHELDLAIRVRDCRLATRWTPGDRPFTISWRDEFDREHLDRAGDFDRSLALSLTSYIDDVCDHPPDL